MSHHLSAQFFLINLQFMSKSWCGELRFNQQHDYFFLGLYIEKMAPKEIQPSITSCGLMDKVAGFDLEIVGLIPVRGGEFQSFCLGLLTFFYNLLLRSLYVKKMNTY